MNDQTKLTEADGLRVANLQLRQQLVDKDRAILELEQRLLQQHIHATYGNPGESVQIGADGSIVRKPA